VHHEYGRLTRATAGLLSYIAHSFPFLCIDIDIYVYIRIFEESLKVVMDLYSSKLDSS